MLFSGDIEEALGENIQSSHPLAGGDVAQAYRIKTGRGDYFLKHMGGPKTQAFVREAQGLEEIRRTGAIPVPRVLKATSHFLLLEFIPTADPTEEDYGDFARSLASMHTHTRPHCGLGEDNFLGTSPQPNGDGRESSWAAFFWRYRLWFQCRRALALGRIDKSFAHTFSRLEEKALKILDIKGPFSLLHGDIWGGNVLFHPSGKAYLIDPAIYYGHREADFGLVALFGGFPPSFQRAYDEALPPEEGRGDRLPFYQLYHGMNHLNLFGGSYRPLIQDILDRLLF